MTTLVISLDGNIGSGKTTLLEAIRSAMPDVEVVLEPVGEWVSLKGSGGKSLLELFYEDKRRWAYTFQTYALLSRLRTLQHALATTTKRIVITERSVLTDRFVFAEMLRASGDIDDLEWTLYTRWFDTFAKGLPMAGIIYLTTGVETSAERIVTRSRQGEAGIPMSYLADLDAQHQSWIASSELPVLTISTESSVSMTENLCRIRDYLNQCSNSQL